MGYCEKALLTITARYDNGTIFVFNKTHGGGGGGVREVTTRAGIIDGLHREGGGQGVGERGL